MISDYNFFSLNVTINYVDACASNDFSFIEKIVKAWMLFALFLLKWGPLFLMQKSFHTGYGLGAIIRDNKP